jgi:hypothetical protein
MWLLAAVVDRDKLQIKGFMNSLTENNILNGRPRSGRSNIYNNEIMYI